MTIVIQLLLDMTTRKKDTICATVSPYTAKQVEELVASGDFSSKSDLVNIALTEFLTKYQTLKAMSESPKIESSEQPAKKVVFE